MNVRLSLTQLSSIRGKVVDGDRRPLRRAIVTVLRATYEGGVRVLHPVGDITRTNEDGEYFFGGLGTGQYYIRANPANDAEYTRLFENPASWDALQNRKQGEPEGYPTAYYPGTMDLQAAAPVSLLNGGNVKNIDIVAAKVRTHRVKGTIKIESEGPQPPINNVLLVSRNAGAKSSFTRTISQPKEEFDFRGVLPGAYYLIAHAGEGRSQLFAREPVDVRDANLLNLTVTLRRGFDIAGSFRFADWPGTTPPDFSQVAINLIPNNRNPTDSSHAETLYTQDPLVVVPSSTGMFVLHNIAPGDYRISISLNPKLPSNARIPLNLKTAYLRSAQIGAEDILIRGLHVGGAIAGELEIVIATNSGSIFGRILDDNKQPVIPARAMIVPDKERRNRFDLFSPIGVTPTGRFTLDGIPPGDYKVFAWAHVEDGAWFDPEFMRVYEDRGVSVHIDEAGVYPIEIPLSH